MAANIQITFDLAIQDFVVVGGIHHKDHNTRIERERAWVSQNTGMTLFTDGFTRFSWYL
jgi:hypothetical protein